MYVYIYIYIYVEIYITRSLNPSPSPLPFNYGTHKYPASNPPLDPEPTISRGTRMSCSSHFGKPSILKPGA